MLTLEEFKSETRQDNNGRPQVDLTGWFTKADKQ